MSDQISTLDGTEPVVKVPASPAHCRRVSKSSNAAKLLQAAALAAVLVPLGSVAAEASSCHFGGSTSCASNAGGEGFTLFEFGSGGSAPYRVGLRFDTIVGEFDIDIDDIAMDEATMLAKLTNFPGFRPVPIGDDPAPFIEFRVTDHSNGPCFVTPTNNCSTATNTWISQGARGPAADQGYDMRFYWLNNTDGLFPDPHVLHATGSSELYDIDISDGSYATFVPCDVFGTCSQRVASSGDPAAGGRDDMFTAFTLADPTSPVPEPASLVLLGTGISGWLYRRRRRG
jgi:hypothetical protein